MDTSGLSSSISLAAFLVGFGYLSLVQEAISLNASFIRTSDSVGRLLSTIGSLRIAAVVATVASVLALILGQGFSRSSNHSWSYFGPTGLPDNN